MIFNIKSLKFKNIKNFTFLILLLINIIFLRTACYSSHFIRKAHENSYLLKKSNSKTISSLLQTKLDEANIHNEPNLELFDKSQREFSVDSEGSLEPYTKNNNKSLTSSYETIENLPIGTISSITNTIYIDPKELKCNIKFIERASFFFRIPTDIIYYTIISKKLPLFDFDANISLNSDINNKINDLNNLKALSVDLYQDKSFKERQFTDDYLNSLYFRDRWVVAVKLNKKVSKIEIDFSYLGERAILIDEKERINIVKLSLFNPFNESFPYIISLILSGISKDTLDLIKNNSSNPESLPNGSTINNYVFKKKDKVIGNGLEIKMNKYFESHSQYEYDFAIPLVIQTCDGSFFGIMYYILVIMTVLFVAISVATLSFLYKE